MTFCDLKGNSALTDVVSVEGVEGGHRLVYHDPRHPWVKPASYTLLQSLPQQSNQIDRLSPGAIDTVVTLLVVETCFLHSQLE